MYCDKRPADLVKKAIKFPKRIMEATRQYIHKTYFSKSFMTLHQRFDRSLKPNAIFFIDHLSLGYICPDHRTIFRSAIFSTIFRHRRRSWAKTYVLTIHAGIVRFFDLPFVDVLIQKRKAIVRQSYVSADST